MNLKAGSDIPLIGLGFQACGSKRTGFNRAIADELKKLDLPFAVLGTGEEKYNLLFKDLNKISKNIKAFIGFDLN